MQQYQPQTARMTPLESKTKQDVSCDSFGDPLSLWATSVEAAHNN